MSDKSELNKIITYIQQLEKRVDELESKPVVIVEGNKDNNQPKPLQLPLAKLIDIYNDVPQVLAPSAVEVSLNDDSYRRKSEDNKIILEPIIRGKYWVILLENNHEKKYYLVPNASVKFKLYRMESINYLFNFLGKDENNVDKFNLNKPCELDILPSGKQWQLIAQGELSIGDKSPVFELVSEIEEIHNIQTKNTSTIDGLIGFLQKIT